jgi:hypothetical protein
MHAFYAIGQMKSASLATVAPGISEALIATAVGLAVAIPDSVAYNMFLGMLESLEASTSASPACFSTGCGMRPGPIPGAFPSPIPAGGRGP